jgi:hypothetical protein
VRILADVGILGVGAQQLQAGRFGDQGGAVGGLDALRAQGAEAAQLGQERWLVHRRRRLARLGDEAVERVRRGR